MSIRSTRNPSFCHVGVRDARNSRRRKSSIPYAQNDAKPHRGKFQTVTAEAISVRLQTAAQTFARDKLLRVSAKHAGHRLRPEDAPGRSNHCSLLAHRV